MKTIIVKTQAEMDAIPADIKDTIIEIRSISNIWIKVNLANGSSRVEANDSSRVSIYPNFIPLLRDGKPITFGAFNANEVDEKSGCYVHRSVARLEKGIPNPKVRPVIPAPWELEFTLELFPNNEIKEQEILNLIDEAGRAIGLGTFRGVFGKYEVIKWE